MDYQKLIDNVGDIIQSLGVQLLSTSDSLVNWEIATGVALDLAGKETPLANRDGLNETYFEIVETVKPLVVEYLPGAELSFTDPVCVFDRKEWTIANVENIKALLKPLGDNYWKALSSYLDSVYSTVGKVFGKFSQTTITFEIGILLGYMSRKVMAQYDWGIPTPEGLLPKNLIYFVESNISQVEQKYKFDSLALRQWIALHEVTHSFQFKAHPWIGEYLTLTINQYLELLNQMLDSIEENIPDKAAPLYWSKVWGKKMLSQDHWSLIRKAQAVMSLIEGFSDYVMIRAGKSLSDYDRMLTVFRERRRKGSPAEKLLRKLIGFDIKARQYEMGEKFVSYVASKKGLDFLNQVWNGPEYLPSLQEIKYPTQWITRLG